MRRDEAGPEGPDHGHLADPGKDLGFSLDNGKATEEFTANMV